MNSKDTLENESIKDKIRQIFIKNVKNRKPDITGKNIDHAGKFGHWAESAMGIKANNRNKPDLLGFELKNNTTSKTSFGDWSSNESIFKKKKFTPDEVDEIVKLRNEGKRPKVIDVEYIYSYSYFFVLDCHSYYFLKKSEK